MTRAEMKAFELSAEKINKKVASSPKAACEFLKSVGILTKQGKVQKRNSDKAA